MRFVCLEFCMFAEIRVVCKAKVSVCGKRDALWWLRIPFCGMNFRDAANE